jgi:hypothetical protein
MLPAILPVFGLPLIIQTLPGLQVLAPYGFSQVAGLHRASPSATLDKSFVTSLLYHVIGASRSAGLATYNALSPQRIDIRLGSGHHKLRRHHLRDDPIRYMYYRKLKELLRMLSLALNRNCDIGTNEKSGETAQFLKKNVGYKHIAKYILQNLVLRVIFCYKL